MEAPHYARPRQKKKKRIKGKGKKMKESIDEKIHERYRMTD